MQHRVHSTGNMIVDGLIFPYRLLATTAAAAAKHDRRLSSRVACLEDDGGAIDNGAQKTRW